MDIVSMPKLPGCRTTFAKILSIQAVDSFSVFNNTILLKMGMASKLADNSLATLSLGYHYSTMYVC